MSLEKLSIMGSSGSQVEVKRNAMLIHRLDKTEGFGWTTVTADIAAGETAVLVTNLSTTKHLHIVKAFAFSDVHSALLLNLPTFATFTGTAVVGIPLNRAAISIAPATAWADETGNGSENTFARVSTNELSTGQHGVTIELGDIVKLGYRDSFSIDIVANSTAFYTAVIGYYH